MIEPNSEFQNANPVGEWYHTAEHKSKNKGSLKRAYSINDCDWVFRINGDTIYGLSNGSGPRTLFTNVDKAPQTFMPSFFLNSDKVWEKMSTWSYLNEGNEKTKKQRYGQSTSEDLLTLIFVECLKRKGKLKAFCHDYLHTDEKLREIYFGGQEIYPEEKSKTEFLQKFKECSDDFKESEKRRTEPDLMFLFQNSLRFVEVKAGAKISAIGKDKKTREGGVIKEGYLKIEKQDYCKNNWGTFPFINPSSIDFEPLYEIFRNIVLGRALAEKIFGNPSNFSMFTLTPAKNSLLISDFNKRVKEEAQVTQIYWEEVFQNKNVYPCSGCNDCTQCFFRKNLNERLSFILNPVELTVDGATLSIK
jgi:hypothetical protein